MKIFAIFLFILVPVLLVYVWWKLFNTPNGERYLRMRIQGPFVPASDDEAKKDEQGTRDAPKA